MNVQVKVSPSTIVTVDGDSVKDCFAAISRAQEVFGQEKCGKCGGSQLRFATRTADDNTFYEIACQNMKCRHRLQFGQTKKGGELYPRRKDKDGRWLPNNGWVPPYKRGDDFEDNVSPSENFEDAITFGDAHEG